MRYLDQDGSAIDQDRLTSAESFLHQEQIGFRDVMGFSDSAYRQTFRTAAPATRLQYYFAGDALLKSGLGGAHTELNQRLMYTSA